MRLFFLFLICSLSTISVAQSAKVKVPSYFGFQIKPLFPTRFIGNPELTQSIENFNTTLSQRTGYSFGGVVRVGLTRFIALETGIHFNQRNFDIDMSIPDSNFYYSNTLSFTTYTIPVNALFYIRLADKWYMNTAIGASMSYNPTNVGKRTDPDGYADFRHTGLAKKVILEVNGAVGFEFRTKKSGIFYLGGALAVPFSPIFYLQSEYSYQGLYLKTNAEADGKVDGSYLAIEFKYFFPLIKSKGSPFLDGPIEN